MATTENSSERQSNPPTVDERPSEHLRQLRTWAIASWGLSAFLMALASFLPLFDSSPLLLIKDLSSALPLLRWDTFHFGHIARSGYVYEHQWAFFPGVPFLMKTGARFLHNMGPAQAASWETLMIAGSLACLTTSSTATLYELTLSHTSSPTVAYLTGLLSLIPTSPATLRLVGCSEPFFTYCSYAGMLHCARSEWFLAACWFTLAGVFRSNGFMLSGFIIWGLLVEPILKREQIRPVHYIKCVLLAALPFIPFVSLQYAAYVTFCRDTSSPASWCSNFPPSIYTHVQSKYWNVGLLNYWTMSQIPNFLMCAPILVLLLWFTTTYIQASVIPRVRAFPSYYLSKPNRKATTSSSTSSLLSLTLAPHIIHAFILTLIYIFASHTQIILRQAAAMPTTYWAAAYLLMEKPQWGKWWVGWSVVWGAVSIVLWTTFLPPA